MTLGDLVQIGHEEHMAMLCAMADRITIRTDHGDFELYRETEQ